MNLKQIEELALELIEQKTLDLNDKRLTLKDGSTNVTVAHVMVANGYTFPLESELLKLADDQGWTVAHVMANAGFVFPEDSELLKLADNKGWTVAQAMSFSNYRPPSDDVLTKLVSKDIKGYADDL